MAHPDPVVSVVLPTHNRADVLPFAVASVLYQSFPSLELLIVGDGCTDNTKEVVAGFEDERIRWFDLPKAPGFGYANRNVALRQARGEFVAYMPHDDLWLVDHLERLVRLANDRNVDFAHSRPVTVDRLGGLWPSNFNLEAAVGNGPLTAKDLGIGIAPVLHRRDCLDRFGYWDDNGAGGGDHRLWIEIIDGGRRRNFAFLPDPTSLHFLASWRRRNRKWWQTQKNDLRQTFGFFDVLPEILSVSVPDGQTEQEAIWASISDDPQAWAQEFRITVQALFDSRLQRLDDFLPMVLAVSGSRMKRLVRGYFQHLSRRDLTTLMERVSPPQTDRRE